MSARYWKEVGPSRFEHEREALRYLKERLPDHEPWRVWSNFEFIARDGSLNEVDLLVISKVGIFLVEIKSYRGVVRGDQGTFQFVDQDQSVAYIDNPLFAANLKAKRLKALLLASKAFREKPNLFIEALVFLSHASGCELAPPADTRILLRDQPGAGGRPARPGIVAALTERLAPGLLPQPKVPGDRPLAKTMERALAEIGIAPARERRRVKDYELIGLIEETSVWRDSRARHVSMPTTFRRIRHYFCNQDAEIERHRVHEAAKREFHLLERLEHPGILRATEYTIDEQGPVIIMDDTEGYARLDRYLAEHGAKLAFDERLDLIRKVAEPVQYAHGEQIVHRCLGPQSVLVRADSRGHPDAIKVMNWQSGTHDGSTSLPSYVHATLHPETYQDAAAAVYLAPELRRFPASTDPALDVFSLGALAFLILTGRPPAESPDALYDAVKDGGLRLPAVTDATEPALDELVARATHPNVSDRFPTVGDFLKGIDAVEEALTRPEGTCDVPPDAQLGSIFPDGTVVLSRLGSGATAVAFLVERPTPQGPQRCVLKVASDVDHSARLTLEAAIVTRLDHPHIVRHVGDFEAGGYKGFFTRPANDQTLRQRLAAEGPLQLELLERFGSQLLDALAYLESEGIAHRDVKPDNIGITDFEQRRALGIVLFDFSLSGSPVDNPRIGTPAYNDPFVEDRPNRRWDLHAERFSAAMTLHEMATGVLPRWGDGKSLPRATKGEVVLDGNRFPGGVRKELLAFFGKALARAPANRFDNAQQMLDSWRGLFQRTQHEPGAEAPGDIEHLLDHRLDQGPRTPVTELPLSTRAGNALDRMGIFTVTQLLQVPPGWLLRTRGVGARTRGEIEDLIRRLRRRFPEIEIDPAATRRTLAGEPTETPSTDEEHDPGASVEVLLDKLRQGGSRLTASDRRFMTVLLGLDEPGPDTVASETLPTQGEAAERAGVSRQRISQVMAKLRSYWAEHPVARMLADELTERLDRGGGIMTINEATEAILADRGSAHEGEQGRRLARALVRIATESESEQTEPRWSLRRREDRQYVAATDDHVRYAEALGARARALAERDPLPARAEVETALAQVPRPDGVPPFPPGRLARLAASAAPGVELSRRGELYPVGLSAERAVRLSVGTIVGAGRPHPDKLGRRLVTPQEVEQRVRQRYPAAGPLPAPDELLAILQSAGWDVSWSPEQDTFETRTGDLPSVEGGSTVIPRYSTVTAGLPPAGPEAREADEFERRVRDVIEGRRFLILKTAPKYLERAAEELVHRFPELESMDLDARLIEAIDEIRIENKVQEDRFLTAEARGPADPVPWSRVMSVVAKAIDRVTARLLAGDEPALLRHVGLLARYAPHVKGAWAPIEKLNALLAGGSPRACIVLIPGDVSLDKPLLDGASIPHISSNQYAVVPEPWLKNVLHAAVAS